MSALPPKADIYSYLITSSAPPISAGGTDRPRGIILMHDIHRATDPDDSALGYSLPPNKRVARSLGVSTRGTEQLNNRRIAPRMH